MTNTNEEKINKLLEFPYDAFLMVRLEYVQILGDELEAKLLRIIEKYIDMERRRIYQKTVNAVATNGQVAEITKDVWVPISYRLFMNDLFGTVTSENTVKKALKKMIDKRIIFQRFQPKKKYDAPEYKIHINPLQTLLGLLTNPGYQFLIPSYIDTLKDLPPQELTPSECQKLIPLAALRVSKIDTNITEVTDNNREVITERESTAPESDTPTVSPPDVGDSRANYPLITFADCLAYLEQQGVSPRGDAVEQMVQARTLYAHKHPRYEYRARPGLSEHPDDQLPGEYWPENDDPEKTLPGVQAVSKPVVEPAQQNHSAGTPNGAVVGDVPLGNPPAQGAASPKGKGKKPAEPKPETPKSPPVEPPSDMPWGTRKCLLWFDYWRGGILIGKFKLMQASTCAKGLAEQFSEQQVIQARTDMEADPYYIGKGGCDVCDVANNIHKYLKRKQQTKKPAQSTNAAQSQPITNIRELVRQREAMRAATAVQVGV